MMDDHAQPDTFTPPLDNLSSDVNQSLAKLLKSFKSHFVKDDASIGITNLTKMQTDTGNSKSVSQKLYPIAMKHYD